MSTCKEVQEIGDAIAVLSQTQAAELLDYLDVVYGIEVPAGMIGEQQVVPPTPPPPPEQTEWSIYLEGYDPAKKIVLIKTLREVTGLALKESLEAINTPPTRIKENV